MKYLQRVQEVLKHTDSLPYLLKVPGNGLSYNTIVRYNDKISFGTDSINPKKTFYSAIRYGNLLLIIDLLKRDKELYEDLICLSANNGRFRFLMLFLKLNFPICKYSMNHAANGRVKCLKLLHKWMNCDDTEYMEFMGLAGYGCLYSINYPNGKSRLGINEVAYYGHPKCAKLLYKWHIVGPSSGIYSAAEGHPKCFNLCLKNGQYWLDDNDKLYIIKKAARYPKCRQLLYQYELL